MKAELRKKLWTLFISLFSINTAATMLASNITFATRNYNSILLAIATMNIIGVVFFTSSLAYFSGLNNATRTIVLCNLTISLIVLLYVIVRLYR